MDEVNVTTIELNGKEYFLVDSLGDQNHLYHFFSSVENQSDFCVLKDKNEDGESFYVSLDNDAEFDYAMSLFYQKYQDDFS